MVFVLNMLLDDFLAELWCSVLVSHVKDIICVWLAFLISLDMFNHQGTACCAAQRSYLTALCCTLFYLTSSKFSLCVPVPVLLFLKYCLPFIHTN